MPPDPNQTAPDLSTIPHQLRRTIAADRRRRPFALAAGAIAFVVWWRLIGLPSDIITVTGWLWLASICWHVDRPVRHHLGFLRDWLPIVAVLTAYDISRGLADDGAQPHVTEMIQADRAMFGGEVPTVWLQARLYDVDVVHWWDAIVSWTYFSHFVAAPVIALVLWLRNRRQWGRFIRRWLALSAAGLTTYFLYPAAPPWWAAQEGLIDHVERISSRGWRAIGLHNAGHLLSLAQNLSNPVAAMPSLHSAFALFTVLFFADRVRRRWWPLLAAYPILMGFSLVYSGEHWVIDVFIGWSYALVAFVLVAAGERTWDQWRAARLVRALDQPQDDGVTDDDARLASTRARWR